MPKAVGNLETRRRCGSGDCQNPLNVPLHIIKNHDVAMVKCDRCSHEHALRNVRDMSVGNAVSQCVWCGGREFFIRKDFPQKVGLGLVIVFGIVASVFYYYENVIATFATLGSLVVVDAVIYLFVGRATVCYKCRAEYRGVGYNADHRGFDLATSEKYSHS